MEKENIESHDRIELRSEKVREILGTIPNGLVRWGIVVITVIFATLIGIILCVEFPYGNGETIFEHIFRQ
ncbi:MAG: hypothetical protein K2P62_09880 [Phocaeicola sp.]|nr:hypothetical protein [Phocaeicola sp.]